MDWSNQQVVFLGVAAAVVVTLPILFAVAFVIGRGVGRRAGHSEGMEDGFRMTTVFMREVLGLQEQMIRKVNQCRFGGEDDF